MPFATGALLAGLLWLAWLAFDWAILRGVFAGDGRPRCLSDGAGACWSVIANRWRLIIFGLFPFEEQWRSALACFVIVTVAALSCIPAFWSARRLAALWLGGFTAFYVLMRGGMFGLTAVLPQYWGGLSLNIFVFCLVVILGMPLSIAMALMRRSELKLIARTTGAFIDIVRGIPLLAILFTFSVVLPFVIPNWMSGDKLYRVIIGFSIFYACYQAEILRGGLQALPDGQDEAAKALGMSYFQRVGHILLPQAFRRSLPPTINQIVTTLKDTSLVLIVGFFEMLGSGSAAFGNAEWQFANKEVYVFVALVFFAFVFSLSRYGAFLERRMSRSSH
ncbi:amino acid ABC transporter permease [Bosea sp. LjRoot9]|uniref:amino acid ABC transporter permease n=1 Tax=Bosea sp. LjRoot9 TaxID=3342341 RepID=UPI003ECDB046